MDWFKALDAFIYKCIDKSIDALDSIVEFDMDRLIRVLTVMFFLLSLVIPIAKKLSIWATVNATVINFFVLALMIKSIDIRKRRGHQDGMQDIYVGIRLAMTLATLMFIIMKDRTILDTAQDLTYWLWVYAMTSNINKKPRGRKRLKDKIKEWTPFDDPLPNAV